jgi:hypothetical protein
MILTFDIDSNVKGIIGDGSKQSEGALDRI